MDGDDSAEDVSSRISSPTDRQISGTAYTPSSYACPKLSESINFIERTSDYNNNSNNIVNINNSNDDDNLDQPHWHVGLKSHRQRRREHNIVDTMTTGFPSFMLQHSSHMTAAAQSGEPRLRGGVTTNNDNKNNTSSSNNSSNNNNNNNRRTAYGTSQSAGGMEILNAETYTDQFRQRKDPTPEKRRRVRKQKAAPVPVGDDERDVKISKQKGGSDEREGNARLKRQKTGNASEDDEGVKRPRGRPRLDAKDDTAHDRRRKQIRLAQRAYRQRKETTISVLERQVQELRSTNEEMNNIFINLHDFAMAKGLLKREPEFGRHLKFTTERFLELASSAAPVDSPKDDENAINDIDNDVDQKHGMETLSRHVPFQAVESGSAQRQEVVKSSPIQAWGYEIVQEDASTGINTEPDNRQQQQQQDQSYQPSSVGLQVVGLQVVTQATTDNASFNFDFAAAAGDDLLQYHVELPDSTTTTTTAAAAAAIASPSSSALAPAGGTTGTPGTGFMPLGPLSSSLSNSLSSSSSLPIPRTASHHEATFARRLTRLVLERGYELITHRHPDRARVSRIFGFCLNFETPPQIAARLKACIGRSAHESLYEWRAPFLHVGGAGTYYPLSEEKELGAAAAAAVAAGESNGGGDTNGNGGNINSGGGGGGGGSGGGGNVAASLMPRFLTGMSMGPFTPAAMGARDRLMRDGMRTLLDGFGGDFFDPSDVSGYLRGRGAVFAPGDDSVELEYDVFSLYDDMPGTNSSGSSTGGGGGGASGSGGSGGNMFSPGGSSLSLESIISGGSGTAATGGGARRQVDGLLVDAALKGSASRNNNRGGGVVGGPETMAATYSAMMQPYVGFEPWNSMSGTQQLLQLQSSKPIDNALGLDGPVYNISSSNNDDDNNIEMVLDPTLGMRRATVSVGFLIEELISRTVCLGRTPGFRPTDVDAAIRAAVRNALEN